MESAKLRAWARLASSTPLSHLIAEPRSVTSTRLGAKAGCIAGESRAIAPLLAATLSPRPARSPPARSAWPRNSGADDTLTEGNDQWLLIH